MFPVSAQVDFHQREEIEEEEQKDVEQKKKKLWGIKDKNTCLQSIWRSRVFWCFGEQSIMQVENFTSSNGCRLSEGLNGVNL